MDGELVPNTDTLRMSDRDREKVVARLHDAVGEGRLSIDEFEERLTGVLAARTFGDIVPFVADLPASPRTAASQEPAHFTVRGSSLRRSGRWVVPPRMHVEATGSRVVLDFTEAVMESNTVDVSIDVHGCSVRLIVPPGSTADVGGVSVHGSSVKARRLATSPMPMGPHFTVTGVAHGSSVLALTPRTWRWPWERRRSRRVTA